MSIDLGSAFGTIRLEADQALQATSGLGRALSGLAGPAALMGGAIMAAGAAAGGALTALGASSVGVAADFQSAMAVMSTAVDPSSLGVASAAAALDILGDAALAVGSDTALVGVSASTSAEAITGLSKAGLSTSEIFGDLQGYLAGTAELSGALRASIDLAAASELDMVQASDLAAITLATFGGHLATEAERAAFINEAMGNFVQTADASVASVSDLAAAMVAVGPSAAAFGIPLEDVNTALGILSTRGIAGSEAGTALKSMLTNMMRDTPAVSGALQELGIALYDVDGSMRPLPNIMAQFEAGLAGMTEEQRNQYVQTIAGTYGMNAMNSLLGEGTAGWAAMEAAVGSAATMQATAAARTNTLAGAQEALAGVWEAFQIQVGTALIPVLTTLADIGARLLERFGPPIIAAFETVGGVVASFVANLQEGMSPLNAFIEAIWDVAPPELLAALVRFRDDVLPGLVARFQEVVGPIVAAVTHFVSFKDVLVALGIAVAAAVIPAIVGVATALAPILLTVGAVIAVVALLRNAWENNWGGIQEKTAAVIGFIQPLVQNALEAIRAWWDENGAAILAAARAAWETIQSVVSAVVGGLAAAIGSFLSDVRAWWAAHGAAIVAAAEDAWQLIEGVIDGVVRHIELVVDAFRLAFEGDWRGFGEKLFEIWENAWNTIVDFLSGLWDMVRPWLTGLWESVQHWFTTTDWRQLGQNVIDGIVGGLRSAGEAIIETIMGFVTAAWDRVKTFFGISSPSRLMFYAGEMIAQGLIDGIRSQMTAAADVMDALFAAMGNVSGLAGGFGSHFQRQVLDPLQASVDASAANIARYDESIARMIAQLGYASDFAAQPGAELELLRLMNYEYASPQQRATAEVLLAFLRERNRLNADHLRLQQRLTEEQERLARLEEQQAQNAFLQEQLKLLQLIRDNNLSTSILDGLQLGLGADAGALMEAMGQALSQLIHAAEQQLGIASPSAVFRRIGQQVNDGLRLGLADNRAVVGVMRDTLHDLVAAGRLDAAPALIDAGRTAHLYGGQHFYFQEARGSVLDDIQALLAP